MTYLQQLISLFAVSLVSAFVCTKLLITTLLSYNVVDIPDDRRLHKVTTPRGGGVALVLTLLIWGSIFEYCIFDHPVGIVKLLPIFLAIAGVSLWDDVYATHVLIRFIIHLICSSIAVWIFIYPSTLLHNKLPIAIDFLLTTIVLTAFLNIYNFLDGIDGITAIESIHLAITIIILCTLRRDIILHAEFIMRLATLVLACAMGFGIFNWYPAKIFIGDVGSIGFGFLLGLCLLMIATSDVKLFTATAIASLYYLADGGLTILIRLVKQERIWQPHLKHFFQQALKSGMSHTQIIYKIMCCNFLLMLLAINALYFPIISAIIAIIVVSITLLDFKECG